MNIKEEKYILINFLGIRDPWNEWNKDKTLEEVGNHYGAALSLVEKYQENIDKVFFFSTRGTEISKNKIEAEMQTRFSQVQYEWISSGIENPTDLEEIEEKTFDKLKDIQSSIDLSSSLILINSSSGSPQITQYLNTLFLVGFLGEPYKKTFIASVDAPDFNNPKRDRIKIHKDRKKEPIKSLYDASHIATLINRYDYSAALVLAKNSSLNESFKSVLKLLQSCFGLDFAGNKFSLDKLQNLPKDSKAFLFNSFNHNESSIKKALYYFATQEKIELEETQEAIIRFGVLRETLAIDYLLLSEVKEFIRESEKKKGLYYVLFNEIPEKIRNKYLEIGERIYPIDKKTGQPTFQAPSEKLKLMSESAHILLESLYDTENDFVQVLLKTKEIQNQRNNFAHSVKETGNKFPNLKPDLISLMNTSLPEHKAIWEGENFFDMANRELLKQADLDWLLKKGK